MKLLLLCLLCASVGARVDETMKERASGIYVVEAVVKLIYEKCLFGDDKLLLRRLAYVESRDGTDPDTFRSGYYGGIWQVGLWDLGIKIVALNFLYHSRWIKTFSTSRKASAPHSTRQY